MLLSIEFQTTPPPLKNIDVKVYERNFFTQPIRELTTEIPS